MPILAKMEAESSRFSAPGMKTQAGVKEERNQMMTVEAKMTVKAFLR